MNIKSLLLGSAAALVAVSGARAADAVVIPEPEAVEYVRVCDAAGAGYFYIPGGETCLKISGYVRYQIGFAEEQEGWEKASEGLLLIESWTDSDYGAVTTTIRLTTGSSLVWDDDNEDGLFDTDEYGPAGIFEVDRAYFTIAGLSMGYMVNLYDFSATGAFDDFVGAGSTHQAGQYTVDFGGGSLSVQLLVPQNDLSWTPDVVAKAAFDLGGLALAAGVAYDTAVDDGDPLTPATDDPDAYSAKLTAEYAGFGAVVQYSEAASDYSGDNEWVIGANYGFDATDKLNLNIGAAYATGDFSDDTWGVGVEAAQQLTDTFVVSARARYYTTSEDEDTWDARMRFKASF